ncbi:hypothetical protein P875_00138406 [Aspergillus parasiticus SU-1]|uniref:HAMP domain-containing protein n=1 Tax=Aspergillus parasiticus (strain ATCC 56775 / NRRL 5862 / SRRC 143 / SU-1) TaxID=1403190 RepID=A0A0F0IE66_ASPPU|nr:hypothetical protein P875_00138406 [Aspergillus parasiticus SU-1]
MLPFVKIINEVVDRVNKDTEKIKSAEQAEEDILYEWSSELDRVTMALGKLNNMFDRFTNGDWQSRLERWTDDDIEDVGDTLDKLMTALENYTNAFLDKAPAQDNWPGIGPEISQSFQELAEAALKMRETIPWYLFGDDQVAATEAEKDRSAEDIVDELNDPFYFSKKLFPENVKLQRCTALNLTFTLCVIAWNPPKEEEEAKHDDAGPDMLQFCTSPRMIAFFATCGASEAVAGYFGKGAFAAEKLQLYGRDTHEADFWMHW